VKVAKTDRDTGDVITDARASADSAGFELRTWPRKKPTVAKHRKV
jgi:hypothetical protein